MFTNTIFQYSSFSQWILFLGIALILFGWFEKKDKFLLAGQLLFALLGLFALWVVLTELNDVHFLNGGKITKEIKVGSYFKGLIILGVIDFASLLQKLFGLRFQKAGYVILLLTALMLFFMVFNVLQMPA